MNRLAVSALALLCLAPTFARADSYTDTSGGRSPASAFECVNPSTHVASPCGGSDNPVNVQGSITANLGTLNGAATAAKQDTAAGKIDTLHSDNVTSQGKQDTAAGKLDALHSDGQAVTGVTQMSADTSYTAGRYLKTICTAQGNVTVTLLDASTDTLNLNVGMSILNMAVTRYASAGMTAACALTIWK